MNRRANLYLNIYGIIAFILSLACFGLIMALKETSYDLPSIMKILFLTVGIISGILFISIEVFLFILMNNKTKLIYIIYMIADAAVAILINTKIPFSAFLVFTILKILKDMLRIKLVDKLYISKEFDRYCKMINVKIPDFKKKKKISTKNKEKEIINILVEENVDVTTKSKSKNKRTKTPALKKAI